MNPGKTVLGLVFVALGALFLLDQQGAVDAGEIISQWWPTAVLALAVLHLLRRPPQVVAAFVFGVLGIVLLGITTDVVDATVWAYVWPLALVALGLWLLFGRTPAEVRAASRDQKVDVTAVFSGREVVSHARPFKGGVVTAVFGGVDLDLTGAVIEGEAVLETVALFGGVEIKVPDGWQVRMDGPAIFGGNENHARGPFPQGAPTLRISATSIFGGTEVKVAARTGAPVAV